MLPDKLEQQLQEPGLTDLVINGADTVFANFSGSWTQLESPFSNDHELQEFAVGLATAFRKRLDFGQPFADVSFGQFRIHLVLPFAGQELPLVSIRKHGVSDQGLEQLLENPIRWHDRLVGIVRDRQNFIICGGTGSGKTTLLRAMISLAGNERVITAEDVPELSLKLPNAVSLVTRQPNSDGAGQIDLQRLVVESLRMKPDRLVVGEVRGAELIPMLQALNSGHRGSATTVHANRAEDLSARLIGIGLQGGISPATSAHLAASAFDVVIALGTRSSGINVQQIAPLSLENSSKLVVKNEF